MTGLLTMLLLQSTPADLEIIYDVCWMLTPTQIQRMCTNYYVADYEVSIHNFCMEVGLLTQRIPDSHLTGDPPRRRFTGIAQRPQRPPAPRARD